MQFFNLRTLLLLSLLAHYAITVEAATLRTQRSNAVKNSIVFSRRNAVVGARADDVDQEVFTAFCNRPSQQQAVAFLNAYWHEVSDQADFIYSAAWKNMKYADMHAKGISQDYLYDERDSNGVDFVNGAYFYQKLVEFLRVPQNSFWTGPTFEISQPVEMTSIARQMELRETVDVNLDGRLSFLEYLLHQYQSFANSNDFTSRSMQEDEHPAVRKAFSALDDVNGRIRDYEDESARLEAESTLRGIMGLRAKNQLAQLPTSPLYEELNQSLINAKAAVDRASTLFTGGAEAGKEGAIWWMKKSLSDKQAQYGKK